MTDTLNADELLTEAEAAALLRIKPDTLRHWRMRRKKGPRYIQPHPHGRVLYQRCDIAEWIKTHRKDASTKKRKASKRRTVKEKS